jgi:hypothetical protein
MVHLAAVKKDKEVVTDSLADCVDALSLEVPGEDDFSTSVYGSRYAATELPQHEMPEKEMPRDIAYRMIKDDLSLDGNPMLKYVLRSPTIETKLVLDANESPSSLLQLGQFRHNLHGKLNQAAPQPRSLANWFFFFFFWQ